MNQLRFFRNPRNLIQCLWVFIIFAIVSCTQSPQTIIEPTKTITRTVNPTIAEANNSQITLQPEITQTPQTQPAQTPQPKSTIETPVTTPTTALDDEDATGQLFIFQTSGIYQINLPEEEITPLFETKKDYKNWGARFAQNKKLLAYWLKEENETELWFTPLSDWQPELLLTVDDLEYDFATLLWGVNDQYLFFMLSVIDDSGPLEDIKTVGTYIIDTETMDLVGSSYWPGKCSILAPSSISGQIALWCHQLDEQNQEYLVLEPEQAPWLTDKSPNTLIDDCNTYATCDWSQDGEYVVYIDMDKRPNEMFYSSVALPNPTQISDGVSDIYAFPLWSPNNQFLYYDGDCIDGGSGNPTVLSVLDERIVWCVPNNSNRGEFGILFVEIARWSPNSKFLAIPIFPDTQQEILVFDILNQEEWGRISSLDAIIQDMVWIDE